uniref:Uncharacterized protein n=1 Tax=Pipistrellus kuhlii TaxID=59472 RepID=A0A7J7RGD8_PIPKU|nr:hypothetical protein mPipKuh1_010546 [Pipistrellus kuhlii]
MDWLCAWETSVGLTCRVPPPFPATASARDTATEGVRPTEAPRAPGQAPAGDGPSGCDWPTRGAQASGTRPAQPAALCPALPPAWGPPSSAQAPAAPQWLVAQTAGQTPAQGLPPRLRSLGLSPLSPRLPHPRWAPRPARPTQPETPHPQGSLSSSL